MLPPLLSPSAGHGQPQAPDDDPTLCILLVRIAITELVALYRSITAFRRV
jgi:hypothetical protein